MLQDHLPCHSAGRVFFCTKLLLFALHKTEFCSQILPPFFAFSHPFSTFFFSLHLFNWYSGFQPFFLAPCFLYCQSFPPPLAVISLVGFDSPHHSCFFLHFKDSSACCTLLHTLLTSSDYWFGISMSSAASLCNHFFLCKWRCLLSVVDQVYVILNKPKSLWKD